MKIGDLVLVKDGTTKELKRRWEWFNDFPESIDGMTGKVVSDYTDLGSDSHYEVDFGNFSIGIYPEGLENLK